MLLPRLVLCFTCTFVEIKNYFGSNKKRLLHMHCHMHIAHTKPMKKKSANCIFFSALLFYAIVPVIIIGVSIITVIICVYVLLCGLFFFSVVVSKQLNTITTSLVCGTLAYHHFLFFSIKLSIPTLTNVTQHNLFFYVFIFHEFSFILTSMNIEHTHLHREKIV